MFIFYFILFFDQNTKNIQKIFHFCHDLHKTHTKMVFSSTIVYVAKIIKWHDKTLFKDNSAAPKYEFITILNLTTILQTTALYQFVSKNK